MKIILYPFKVAKAKLNLSLNISDFNYVNNFTAIKLYGYIKIETFLYEFGGN